MVGYLFFYLPMGEYKAWLNKPFEFFDLQRDQGHFMMTRCGYAFSIILLMTILVLFA
jgi:hypothetical protein